MNHSAGSNRLYTKGKKNPLMTVILILVALIQIFPFYWMLTFSFKNNNDIYGGNIAGLPTTWHWENYVKAFTTGNIGVYLLNSIIVTLSTILFVVVLSCMASYALLRMSWKGQKLIFGLFLIGYMIPIHATLLPLMNLLGKMNLLDSRLALILPYIAFGLPFAVYILSGFMHAVPRELEEAAFIDGCNIYQTFFQIVLPILRPAISTITIFTFLSSWNELMLSMTFINDAAKKTLTYGIMTFEGQYSVDWGTVGAGLAIATIPVLIFYLIFAEAFQKGVVEGAVKG